MSTRVEAPTDNPPIGCTEQEFSTWAAGFRQRRSAELIQERVDPSRIRQMVDLEVDAARRRSRQVQSEVTLP